MTGDFYHCDECEYVGALSFCPTCDRELLPIPDEEVDLSIIDYLLTESGS